MRALQNFAKFNLPNNWRLCPLSEVLELVYGCSLPEDARSGSGFPVFGSNGIVGYHSPPLVDSAGIIVGRKGSAGMVAWSVTPFTPIDTTYFVRLKKQGYSMSWAYHLLNLADLPRFGPCVRAGFRGAYRYARRNPGHTASRACRRGCRPACREAGRPGCGADSRAFLQHLLPWGVFSFLPLGVLPSKLWA